MTPRDATTLKKILTLKEDNFPREPEKWGILVTEGDVSIHPPHGGGFIRIPRKQFNALIDWYQREQAPDAAA